MAISSSNAFYDTGDKKTNKQSLAENIAPALGLAALAGGGFGGYKALSNLRNTTSIPPWLMEQGLNLNRPVLGAGRGLLQNSKALGSLFQGAAGPSGLPQAGALSNSSLLSQLAGESIAMPTWLDEMPVALSRQYPAGAVNAAGAKVGGRIRGMGSLMKGPAGPSGLPQIGNTADDVLASQLGNAQKVTGIPETAAALETEAGTAAARSKILEGLANAGKGTKGYFSKATLGIPEGAEGFSALRAGAGSMLGPALGGMALYSASPLADQLGDALDSSGQLGDILGGATKGAALGAVVPGANIITMPLFGALGGIAGGLWGGEGTKEKKEAKAIEDYQGRFNAYAALGYVDKADVDLAKENYNKALDNGLDKQEAIQFAYHKIDNQVASALAGEDPAAADPVQGMLDQLAQARNEEMQQFLAASQAASAMTNQNGQQQAQMYQDYAKARDMGLNDPHLDAQSRALLNASNPMVDSANQAAIAAAYNPLAILAQQYLPKPGSLEDELMQIWQMQMQYGNQGGGNVDWNQLVDQAALQGTPNGAG